MSRYADLIQRLRDGEYVDGHEAALAIENSEYLLDEWGKKTDWAQEQIDLFHGRTIGLHRADVLKNEIEYLRRQNLELHRVYEERGRQIERLESRDSRIVTINDLKLLRSYLSALIAEDCDKESALGFVNRLLEKLK